MKSITLKMLYDKIYDEGTHAVVMYQKANEYCEKAWLAKIHKVVDILEKIDEVQDCFNMTYEEVM